MLVALSVCVTLVLFEVSVRISGVQPDFFFQLDPDVGAIHIPGKRGWITVEGRRQYVEINSHGYRDVERTLSKKPGTTRIAVLGDSFVAALQVSLEDNLTQVMERQLQADCASKVEVLNFGVSGFGTGQALETFRTKVVDYEPDVTLLFFYPGNDIFDNSRELDIEPNSLHFDLDSNGRLVRLPFQVSDNSVKRWLRAHSKGYLFIRDRLKRMKAARAALTGFGLMQNQGDRKSTPGVADAITELRHARFKNPLPPALERSWQITAALLEEMVRVAESSGTRFAVVVIPNQEEILDFVPDWADEEPPDTQQAIRRTRLLCRRLGIDCVSLVDAFRDTGERTREYYFARDGHWTAAGHRLAAEETLKLVRSWVCQEEGSDDDRTAR